MFGIQGHSDFNPSFSHLFLYKYLYKLEILWISKKVGESLILYAYKKSTNTYYRSQENTL